MQSWLWRSLSRHHPGKLEVDRESDYWADHDEDCHGPIDTNENRREFPDGFRWSCCNKLGDEDGCVRLEGKPLISTPEKVSRRRRRNVDLDVATPLCFSKGDAETWADVELSSTIAPDLIGPNTVGIPPRNISRDTDASSHGKSLHHYALCQGSTKMQVIEAVNKFAVDSESLSIQDRDFIMTGSSTQWVAARCAMLKHKFGQSALLPGIHIRRLQTDGWSTDEIDMLGQDIVDRR